MLCHRKHFTWQFDIGRWEASEGSCLALCCPLAVSLSRPPCPIELTLRWHHTSGEVFTNVTRSWFKTFIISNIWYFFSWKCPVKSFTNVVFIMLVYGEMYLGLFSASTFLSLILFFIAAPPHWVKLQQSWQILCHWFCICTFPALLEVKLAVYFVSLWRVTPACD